MASPASEIVVSTEPPPTSAPSSPQKMIEEPDVPEPEQAPLEQPPSAAGEADGLSKKSFKRKYRKLLNKYLKIRATNMNLHNAFAKGSTISSQLSNETANLLDFLVDITPSLPPSPPPPDAEEPDPPSPSTYNFDAHFGYSPTPSPPPEVANQLTQPQIAMGMYKLEPGTGTGAAVGTGIGSMGPPMPVAREESVDTFTKARTAAVPRRATAAQNAVSSRKRKDRDSEGEENGAGTLGRKKTRG